MRCNGAVPTSRGLFTIPVQPAVIILVFKLLHHTSITAVHIHTLS